MLTIRVLRALLAIPRNVVAKASGVSYREITRIESGEVVPSMETLQSLDRALIDIIRSRSSKAARRGR